MSAALLVHRDAEHWFSVRITIAVFHRRDSAGNSLRSPHGSMRIAVRAFGRWHLRASGVVNDALAICFVNTELARAFVNRWCIGFFQCIPPV